MINTEIIPKLDESFSNLFSMLDISLKAGDEKLNSINYRGNVKTDKLASISPWLYRKLGRTYGKCFTLKILLGGDEKYVQNGEVDIPKLREFYQKLKSGVITGMLTVNFNLNKRCLAKQVLGPLEKIDATIIFKSEAIIGLFSESIKDLDDRSKKRQSEESFEDSFCINDSFKQVILVPQMDVWVNGERLAIVGGKGLNRIGEVLVSHSLNALDIQNIREISESNIKWIRLEPLNLTPLHFDVSIDDQLTGVEAEELLDLIAWVQINISLMFMGDTVRYDKSGELEVLFIGAGGSAKVKLPRPHSLCKDENFRKKLRNGASIWCEECLWVYDEKKRWVIDRLSTVQCAVANAFSVSDDGTIIKDFLSMASTIHNLIREHWKIFLDGKFEIYFDSLRQINEFVSSTTRSYGKQIDILIKSLNSTMLGAVVTVVGVFIGALLRENFNPIILIIGLAVYSTYLAIFPGLIGMTTAKQHFAEIKKRTRQQVAELKNRIGFVDKKKWGLLKDQLTNSEKRFNLWFCITSAIYGIVCFVALIVIIILLNF